MAKNTIGSKPLLQLAFGSTMSHKRVPMSLLVSEKPPKTTKIEPSEVLDRVAEFLPQFKESTNAMMQQLETGELKADQVNIESVENNEKVIQMDLGVGVFDVKENQDLAPAADLLDLVKQSVHEKDAEENEEDAEENEENEEPLIQEISSSEEEEVSEYEEEEEEKEDVSEYEESD